MADADNHSGKTRIVILISGRGSNLQAIIEQMGSGDLPVDVARVISNRPDAPGLALATASGLPTTTLAHRNFPDRPSFEQALITEIDAQNPDLVVLAGFMRVLSPEFVRHYSNRMINIHPSLLPSFPGLNTHSRALESGASRHGCTVHFVTPEVDAGPIIIQASVPIEPGDNAETLAARVLNEEHRIFPLAIKWFAEHRLAIKNGRVFLDGCQHSDQGLITD
ncbi:MAG: phosphoribosylglycinamide formyltransferase [Gammaproteobacteria bacterium]|nr:phosphoribosylglycinamide formyltransferase [Gammaproteobacteria bacterium]